MSIGDVVQLLTALGVLVTAILSGVAAIIAARAKREASTAKVQAVETHKAVNSRMDEFKKLFEASFIAQGELKERNAEEGRKTMRSGSLIEKDEPVEVTVVGPGVATPLKVVAEKLPSGKL